MKHHRSEYKTSAQNTVMYLNLQVAQWQAEGKLGTLHSYSVPILDCTCNYSQPKPSEKSINCKSHTNLKHGIYCFSLVNLVTWTWVLYKFAQHEILQEDITNSIIWLPVKYFGWKNQLGKRMPNQVKSLVWHNGRNVNDTQPLLSLSGRNKSTGSVFVSFLSISLC